MKVLKFGGSSVASPERIKSVIGIVKQYLPGNVTVVFSAFGGVTDELIATSQLALDGNESYQVIVKKIEDRHVESIRELIPVDRQSKISAELKLQLNELEDVLHGVFLVRERTLRTLDYIMSFGERLSAFIISEACKAAGIDSEFLDARTLIRTDNQFGKAAVDFETTNKRIQEHYQHHKAVQVVTGFIATSETGETTTLGRSGSDYTAAILAGALQATDLEIWTDVDGMMTADPRMVKKAFTIPEMSYEEAMELSHFGAKVIFPATMRPAMANRIPIWIKNTFNPEATGTCIRARAGNGRLIKGISSINNISLLNVQGSGMVGVVGVSMRLFSCLAQEKINVILISQASSEHSICIALESAQAAHAKKTLKKEFQHEIRDKSIDEILVADRLSIVAVVGDGMKHHPGTSGKMFSALGRNGINIVAIAQGSSERNISVVINEENVSKALTALHDSFFLSDTKTVNLFIAGTGLIGGTLLNQVKNQYEKLLQENRLDIHVVGITNSRKMIFHSDGLPLADTLKVLNDDGEQSKLNTFLKRITELNLPNSIFVDCTASDDVASMYQTLLEASISIVTPNKKANSGTVEKYKQLKKTAQSHGSRFLYETNVGAGLPVINTINDLLLSGDTVLRIEGVLSGTLNYIFSSFSTGTRFSEIVREAKSKGYTEPDPRDDLSGVDVARKILILARETGINAELSDIKIESLVPEECEGDMSIDDFFSALQNHDEKFEVLRRDAEGKNQKLRYEATFENGKINVGLRAVPQEHPFHSLSGSDNIILLTTERYQERPMVIRGPGAGAEVTAAGVFADIIRIGNYIR